MNMAMADEAAVTEKAFDEFHLYSLARPQRCWTAKSSRWNSSAPRT